MAASRRDGQHDGPAGGLGPDQIRHQALPPLITPAEHVAGPGPWPMVGQILPEGISLQSETMNSAAALDALYGSCPPSGFGFPERPAAVVVAIDLVGSHDHSGGHAGLARRASIRLSRPTGVDGVRPAGSRYPSPTRAWAAR